MGSGAVTLPVGRLATFGAAVAKAAYAPATDGVVEIVAGVEEGQ